MEIAGWEINEKELQRFDPRWRAKWHAWDRLFECERSDTGCLVYSITEVAMNRLAGRLAVYRWKASPTLVINPRNFECRFWDAEDPVEYNSTGRILFVRGGPSWRRPVPFTVIDLAGRRFAVVRQGEPSFAPEVHEVTERAFRLDFSMEAGKAESALLDLDELEWYELRKL
jgi:hypothetical protein